MQKISIIGSFPRLMPDLVEVDVGTCLVPRDVDTFDDFAVVPSPDIIGFGLA